MADESDSTDASPSPRDADSPIDRDPTDTPQVEKDLLGLAWSEWETIQKKIDNVSTFPFTIKTWTVAVSAALLGLGKGFDIPPKALFAVATVPILFWAIESKHHRVRDILGRRAELLELLIERLAPLSHKSGGSVPLSIRRELGRLPGVALSIKRDRKSLQRERLSLARPAGRTLMAWTGRNLAVFWQKWIVRYADPIFYMFQVVLVVAITSSLVWFRTSIPEVQKPSITLSATPTYPALPPPVSTPFAPAIVPTGTGSPSPAHLHLDKDANGSSVSSPDSKPSVSASPETSATPRLLDQPK